MLNNHCHRVTAQLQLNKYYYYYLGKTPLIYVMMVSRLSPAIWV
jgi:hypothetical protein